MFQKKVVKAEFLDPRRGFQPTVVECELRTDPLTGRTGRVAHLWSGGLPRPDLGIYNRPDAIRNCPFCPGNLERVTPKFTPRLLPLGRLILGESTLIPNISPYDAYSALVIMSRSHFLPLEEITEKILDDAFSTALAYCRLVRDHDPQPYYLLAWNYLPPAGATQVHSHLQVIATINPGNTCREEITASRTYYETNDGRSFWDELLDSEQASGQRYLGRTGKAHWLTGFVPRGLMGEVLALLPGYHSVFDLDRQAMSDLTGGMVRIFRYFRHKGIYSFNAALFPGPASGRHSSYTIHLRLIPRAYVQPAFASTDTGFFQVAYNEPVTVIRPEDLAAEIRPYFNEGSNPHLF